MRRDIGTLSGPNGEAAELAPLGLPPCDHLARSDVKYRSSVVACPRCQFYWPTNEVAKAQEEAKR